jgi:hypothetical protein
MRMRTIAVSAVLLAAGIAGADSARGSATATVGGKKVAIDYGRPALKGRPLSELLKQLPEDRIWRAGDDMVTTFTTEGDVMVGDKKVPAGKYSVYVHLPQDGSRALVLNKDMGMPLKELWAQAPPDKAALLWPHLDGYQAHIADKEILRQPLRKEQVKTPVDVFTINLTPAKDGATLNLAWGDESWSVDVKSAK